MTAYDAVHISELEPRGPGGTVRMVRKALGARAFGFNQFEFPPDHEGFEHDEARSRDEEIYVVLAGSGRMRIDGEDVEVRAGSFVRIDPDATRCPYAGPEGLSFLVIGAPIEGPYEPPSWG